MSTDMFTKQGGQWYGGEEETPPTSLRWVVWVAVGVCCLLGLVFLAGFLGGHSAVPTLQSQATRLKHSLALVKQQERALLGQRHCQVDGGQIREVERLLQTGQSTIAASLATMAATDTQHPACPQTRVQLGALAYTARMNALFSQIEMSPTDQGPLLTWRSAETRADSLGVPPQDRLSPLTVASDAYNDHMWQLCEVAFQEAWKEGLVGPANTGQIAFYYADLRNYGDSLVHAGTRHDRERGISLLRVADAISQAYGLERREAHDDLVRLLGPRLQTVPKSPINDPILIAAPLRH